MKHMKKLMALFAALALVLTMAIPAMAAGGTTTYTITINNPVGSYEAYQIFSGRLENGVLSDVQWGTGITEAGKTHFGDAAVKAKSLSGLNDNADEAKAFAKEVAGYLSTTYVGSAVYAAGASTTTIENLPAGYYLIKNTAGSVGEDNYYTDFIMEVVENVTVSPKGDKPSLDKQIKHNDNGGWGVVGDNQIGDTVEFRTITTVPNVAGYTSYDYIIKDTMSAGLTSNVTSEADVTIKVKTENGSVLDNSYYTVTANGNSFEVKINILQAITDGKIAAGDSLYTYYTGVLNKDAKIYNDKQDNTAHLEYSNNPNDTASKGKTPEKKVYDWTYQMEVSKVDGKDSTQLNDAKFVLSREKITIGTVDEATGIPNDTSKLIPLIKNADGSYTIAPAGSTGTTYVITAGKVAIKGLDDAVDYYLYETKAPAGYNSVNEPTKIKISSTYSADGATANAPKISINDGAPSDIMTVKIENNAGTTLPGTGGIGTTIFYVIGGGLMAAAAVLLVAKKRMENK